MNQPIGRKRLARSLAAAALCLLGQAAAAQTEPPQHSTTQEQPPWTVYEPLDPSLPGAGRTIALVSGDEEYRSEEALPQLGKILAARHGFRSIVLYAIDPDTGEVNPDIQTNIPGLHQLEHADLLVIATRFRDLPDEQMAHIDRYLRRGGPVVALRTATHAFWPRQSDTYQHYAWNHRGEHEGIDFTGGFGRAVAGETWIAHHGGHGTEATRGVVPNNAATHPINRGLTGNNPPLIFGPSDVYTVNPPADITPLVLGEVVAGMTPEHPAVEGTKNNPMLPVAWTRTHTLGEQPARVFTTTLGAATDIAYDGTRLLILNGVFWALGLEDSIPQQGVDARTIGAFNPTDFGFGTFVKGTRPEDHAMTPDELRDAARRNPPAPAPDHSPDEVKEGR